MLSAVREQEQAVRFLTRVLEGSLTSPLLLLGSEGTGRRFAIRLLTRTMFCTGDKVESCTCFDCIQLLQNTHPDYTELSAGEKDIGVEAIRSLIEAAYSSPSISSHRIFLIDGADRLTAAAANAFLKTLEEPPSRTRFFLLAESKNGVIPTIQSRCSAVYFRPLSEGYVLSKVQQFEADPTKALVYTRMGEGSVGRSIQFWGSGRLALRDKGFSLLRLSLSKDVAGLFALIDSVDKELPLLLSFLDLLLYDLLMVCIAPEKLINIDLREALKALRVGVNDAVWQSVRVRLREARLMYQRVKINLPFQVKSILVDTFAV